MQNDAQRQLLARVAEGDKAAFAQLYRALEKPLYGFVALKLNDPSEAHDIVHETFMQVWKSASAFEGRSAVKSWVFGIAYRKVVDVIRKQSRMVVSDDMPEETDDGVSAETCLLAAQSADHLRHCLGTLKEDHHVAIRLAFYEDLGYREIASITDVPEGTVKTRIFHAKRALMHCLGGRLTAQDIAP